jgi:DNA-binding response OmpR family regulator/curved DNA-binding protein CbpA
VESRTTALIVDDDWSVLRLLADAMAREGFSVLVEKDGEWALRTFESKQVDLVLLDLILPSLHGFEVARRIREMPRGRAVPIFFLSGVYRADAHRAAAQQKYGIAEFLDKPINLGTLRAALRTALADAYPKPEDEALRRRELERVPAERVADENARLEVAAVEESARPRPAPSMRGDFSSRSFPELLAELYRWRATGVLFLRRDRVKKIVYFRDGRPFGIKSNLLSECLGRLMLREKMIDETECEESLRRMKLSGRQQGTVLIEMGCISPHNLAYALSLQLQEKLYEIFGWSYGQYQLSPGAEVPSEANALDLSAAQVIYEGIKRGYDEARVRAALGDVGPLYVHPAKDPLLRFQEIGLDGEELSLVSNFDGRKSVATLLALDLMPRADALKFLYAMRCSQMIELKAQPAPPPPGGRAGTAPEGERASGLSGPSRPSSITPPPLPSAPWSSTRTPPTSDVAQEKPPASEPAPLLSDLPPLAASGVRSEEKILREHLAGVLEAMKRKDYFEVLGVAPDADAQDIERAYLALAKEYHPDKHNASSSGEVRALASQIYELLSAAHDTLSDGAERERYTSELARGPRTSLSKEISRILAAEGKFQRGEDLLRRGQFKDAAAAFQEAVDLYGDEGEFRAYLGWSLFQAGDGAPEIMERAILEIESGIHLNPKVDKSYLFLGYIHKARGSWERAEKEFEKAIQCNPGCVEALRELKLLSKPPRKE